MQIRTDKEYQSLMVAIESLRKQGKFVATPPFTPSNSLVEIIEKSNIKLDDNVCVLFTIEAAVILSQKGYKNITVVTDKYDSAIEKITGVLGCKYALIEELNMKFNVVIGNPPFNDESSSHIDSNNNRHKSGRLLSKEFIDLSLDKLVENNGHVTLISRVSNIWIGKNKGVNEKKYKSKGLYKVEDCTGSFNVTLKVGIFYFKKNQISAEIQDEFKTIPNVPNNLGLLYKSPNEKITRGRLEKMFPNIDGKYKIIMTANNKVRGTNDKALFDSIIDNNATTWRVVFNQVNGTAGGGGNLGPTVIAEPGVKLSRSCACLVVASKKEAIKIKEYLDMKETDKLIRKYKDVSAFNSKYVFNKLKNPNVD